MPKQLMPITGTKRTSGKKIWQKRRNEQAIKILDYQRGGFLFNYDLLGYGMMALSTFFIGLSIKAGDNGNGGTIALLRDEAVV